MSDGLFGFGLLSQSLLAHHALLVTHHWSGFAQRTTALFRRPGLLHRR
jgi:hypothetical protein